MKLFMIQKHRNSYLEAIGKDSLAPIRKIDDYCSDKKRTYAETVHLSLTLNMQQWIIFFLITNTLIITFIGVAVAKSQICSVSRDLQLGNMILVQKSCKLTAY